MNPAVRIGHGFYLLHGFTGHDLFSDQPMPTDLSQPGRAVARRPRLAGPHREAPHSAMTTRR